MTGFRIDISQLESDRAELQASVEVLDERVGKLRAHELFGHSHLRAGDRVAAAWDGVVDDVAVWVRRFDEAVQHIANLGNTATQTDTDTADALARLA